MSLFPVAVRSRAIRDPPATRRAGQCGRTDAASRFRRARRLPRETPFPQASSRPATALPFYKPICVTRAIARDTQPHPRAHPRRHTGGGAFEVTQAHRLRHPRARRPGGRQSFLQPALRTA